MAHLGFFARKPYREIIRFGIRTRILLYYCDHDNVIGIYGCFLKMVGFPQQTHGFSLKKMIMTWGVKWGETHYFRKPPYKII